MYRYVADGQHVATVEHHHGLGWAVTGAGGFGTQGEAAYRRYGSAEEAVDMALALSPGCLWCDHGCRRCIERRVTAALSPSFERAVRWGARTPREVVLMAQELYRGPSILASLDRDTVERIAVHFLRGGREATAAGPAPKGHP